jgi:hypothetical protein
MEIAMDRMAYTWYILKEKIVLTLPQSKNGGKSLPSINGHNILQANIADYANSLKRL